MPLSHYRVLDLADDRGQFAGFVLAQLGADVICVEPEDGHRSRKIPPFVDDEPGADTSLFHIAYNRGKRSVVADDLALRDLAMGADVVITSEAYPVDLDMLRSANPALVTASITPFGLDGPKADWLATDLTLFAAGGAASVTGDKDRAPIRIGYPQSWHIAALDAAQGILIALRERAKSGLGQHVDASAQQALISISQFCMMNTLVDSPEAQRIAGGLELGPFKLRFVFPCADGHVNVTHLFGPVIGPYTNRLFAWMAAEGECPAEIAERDWIPFAMEVIEGRASPDLLQENAAAIEKFVGSRTKAELLTGAIENAALIAPISTTHDLLNLPHLDDRSYWETIEIAGRDEPVRISGPLARFTASPATHLGSPPKVGEHTEEVLSAPQRAPAVPAAATSADEHPTGRPLEGLKILDLFWALAGPGATRTLADFGATVVRIESETRPEVLRAGNPFRGEDGDPEGSLQYHSSNAGKMALQLNLSVPESRDVLLDMVRWADVVTESFTPRGARKMDVTYEAFREVNPSVIMISSCLMGHSGPLADYPGFGTAGASFAGFYPVTGWADRLPAGPYTAYTDYVSPRFTVAALMAALEHRDRTGEGQHIDISQMEAAMHMLSPLLLDESLHDRTAGRNGNADVLMAPHAIVQTLPTDGDQWIAIACETDAQWATLASVMGHDTLASLPLDERRARSDELESLLAEFAAAHEAHELQARLQGLGVPAHQVQNSTQCVADPQLQHRDTFRSVPHPIHGDSFVEAPGFTLSRSDFGPRWAGPTFGQHTFDVLTDFLGYNADKIADLAAAGCLD